jgi:transcriptional regulator with GAF, ATPase, and Fis domain
MNMREGIVAVLNQNGQIVGTGFLASTDLVVTCAHVVVAAGAIDGDIVQVRFDGRTEKLNALVVPEYWRDSNKGDIAILRLETPPEGITPIPLGNAAGSAGHDFYAYGYATVTNVQGIGARGKIVDLVDNGRLVQLTSQEPDHGMSGGPVLDEQRRVVIGMVTKGKGLLEKDQNLRNTQTTFATSVEIIREVCPELRLTEICPYRSLDVFNEEDAPFFFGREKVVQKMLDSLKREPRFLAVLGPSGSGKSSVVRAGLIPVLRQGKVPGSQKWEIVTIRPANDPFEQLSTVGFSKPKASLDRSVKTWMADQPQKTRLVLFIDQFEEILVSTPVEIRQKFIAELALLLDTSSAITVVLTLRDDFYSRFLQDAPALTAWLEKGSIILPYILEMEDLRAIITKPASMVGLAFDSNLIDIIVSDTCETDQSGRQVRSTVLPLLEFTLTQLWELRQNGQLTYDAYKILGGVTGGLAQWADKAYFQLNIVERNFAQEILVSLVNIGDPAQNLPDNRRMVSISDLLQGQGESESIHTVVQKLADARLLTTHREGSGEFVEIIHDALIREWGQLRNWINDNRVFLSWRQRLEAARKSWVNSDHDDGALLHGALLFEAENWLSTRKAQLLEKEMDFIQASCNLRDREAETSRRLSSLESALEDLNSLASVMVGSLDLNNLMENIVDKLSEILRVDAVSLFLANEEKTELNIMAAAGYQKPLVAGKAKYRWGEGVTGRIAMNNEPFLANSLQDLRSMGASPRGAYDSMQSNLRPESFYGIPLNIIGLDRAIGVLKVESLQRRSFSREDTSIVQIMGSFIATVIYNTQQAEKQFIKLSRDVQTLTSSLAGGRTLSDLLEQIVTTFGEILGADAASIYLLEQASGKLEPRAAYGYMKQFLGHGISYSLGEGVTGTIAQNLTPVNIKSVEELRNLGGARRGKYDEPQGARYPESFIGLPLVINNRAIGVLKAESFQTKGFSDSDFLLGQMLANIIATVIFNAQEVQ